MVSCMPLGCSQSWISIQFSPKCIDCAKREGRVVILTLPWKGQSADLTAGGGSAGASLCFPPPSLAGESMEGEALLLLPSPLCPPPPPIHLLLRLVPAREQEVTSRKKQSQHAGEGRVGR